MEQMPSSYSELILVRRYYNSGFFRELLVCGNYIFISFFNSFLTAVNSSPFGAWDRVGALEVIRTPDIRLRRPTLYPAELRALNQLLHRRDVASKGFLFILTTIFIFIARVIIGINSAIYDPIALNLH